MHTTNNQDIRNKLGMRDRWSTLVEMVGEPEIRKSYRRLRESSGWEDARVNVDVMNGLTTRLNEDENYSDLNFSRTEPGNGVSYFSLHASLITPLSTYQEVWDQIDKTLRIRNNDGSGPVMEPNTLWQCDQALQKATSCGYSAIQAIYHLPAGDFVIFFEVRSNAA